MSYVVITGAGSGIGRATAKYFASKNKNLIIVDVNEKNLLDLKKEITNVQVSVMVVDLSQESQVKEFYDKTKAYDIEVWINNAGLGHLKPLLETDIDKALMLNRVNVDASMMLTLMYAKDYQNKDATLINIVSWNGYSITQGNPIYSATKFYMSALSEAMYWELKSANKPMKIKIICPAATKTSFVAAASNNTISEKEYIEMSHGNYNTPQEVAQFIYEMYLSDELIGYADGTTYTFHKCGPKLPDTNNKQDNPNLLLR